jgi:hypothetical protein
MPIEWKGLGLLKNKKDWLIAFGPPNEGFNFSHWFNMRRYISRDEMQNGLEQKNFSMPFYRVSELSHMSSTYWKFTFFADHCEICGIPDFRNFVYKQDFYIVGFPGLTGHWWPIGSYDKGQFLFYTSDVKIVKFLAKKSIYSLVTIELQKYYQGMGKIQSIADTREQEANPCWPRNGEWVDLNISSKSPCICWKQSTNKLYLAPALQENVATITICDVNRAVLRISRQYGILFLQPFSTSHSPVKWWFQENDWEMHG